MPDPAPLKSGDLVALKSGGPLMTLAGVLAAIPADAPPETSVVCGFLSRGSQQVMVVSLGQLQAMASSGRTLENEALHQEAITRWLATAEKSTNPQPPQK